MSDLDFMRLAIAESRTGMLAGEGGPFGAVIVQGGRVIAAGHNQVLANNDPTAHAEVMAIRAACRQLGKYSLEDCSIYTSCEPCPMCLGAIYWARLRKIYMANSRADAAAIGFDDEFFYQELALPPTERTVATEVLGRDEAIRVFQEFADLPQRVVY